MKKEKPKNIQITNRKATHEYHFLKTYEAGIMLQGTEVKALREGSANLNDAYCFMKDGEMYIKSLFIAEYSQGNIFNHETRRLRKLLLRNSELKNFERKLKEKGLTVVPYKVYFSDRGLAKVQIALAEGKKAHDKRATMQERDNKREMDRLKKIKL